MLHLLLIDSHSEFRQKMKKYFEKEGYTVFPAANATEAYQCLEKYHVDLILLDPQLPGTDGYDFCCSLRKSGETYPILMTSEKCSFSEKRKGYLAGIDNYLEKSSPPEEFLMYIRALLRRTERIHSHLLKIDPLVLNQTTMTITYKDHEWVPAPKEFQLLYLMLSHPGIVFTRTQLLEELWGPDSESDLRTVNTHIARLRKYLEQIPEVSIVSVRGVGYKAIWKAETMES